jgi:23S rRNA (uracil1939-C5)-methyltransferase
MEAIERLSPGTIIYVSCDHQTLIRDLASLSRKRYAITAIERFDMSPQTYHFETVVVLKAQK